MSAQLGVKLFAWCIVLLIVSVLALTFRMLYPLELTCFDYAPRRGVHTVTDMSHLDSPVRVLMFWSQKDAPEKYFRYVLDIVGKLKKAGARVVVVPVPPSTMFLPEIQALIRRISAYDNVVFGDPLKSVPPYQTMSDREFDAPENWWATQPMNNLVSMDWGVSSARTNQRGSLFRFVPDQYRETMKGYTVPDVALQAVKKFAGYSDETEIVRHPGSVMMGKYRITIWEDGYAYVRTSFNVDLFSPFYAYEAPSGDSLRYYIQPGAGKQHPDTDSSWAALSGKIVIINWPYLTEGLKWQWMGYGPAYAQVINAVLTGNFARRYNQWDLAIVFLIIILAAALVISVRTWIAVLILVSGSMLMLAGCVWLFRSYNIIEDPIYLLLTLLLCMLVLPIVKVSHEKNYYKAELENVNEHSASLEQQMETMAEEIKMAKERSSGSVP